MPKQINTYRYGQSLVRMFNLKGRFQPVLDETIVPVVDVGEQEVWRRAWSGGQQIGVAAEKSYVQLQNLGGTDKNVILTGFRFSTTGANTIMIDIPSVGPTLGTSVVQTTAWQDTHEPGTPSTTATPPRTSVSMGGHDAAAVGALRAIVGTNKSTAFARFGLHTIIQPGGRIMFTTISNNIILDWELYWYEVDVVAQ